MEVLWGQCYEGTGAPPFWPWEQVFRECFSHRDEWVVRELLGANAAIFSAVVPIAGASPSQTADEGSVLETQRGRFRFF